MDDSEVEVVNVVGAGGLGVEVDLHTLANDLAVDVKYDPTEHTGMHIHLESGVLITLYRTGSYHIVGVDSEDGLFAARDEFLASVRATGFEVPADGDPFSVRNIVTTSDVGQAVNLNALAVGLGLERVEYEPEQFPGLVYRPEGLDAVVLIFGSGKMVITGVADVSKAQQVRERVGEEIEELFE